MAYFSGEYECTIDAKGRLALPTKVKANLPMDSVSIVVSRGFEPCLVIYSELEWKKVFSKVAGLNEFNEEYRTFQRNFMRGNTEIELDAAGRILLPKSMSKYAGLEKDVILVGLGNRLELWNTERYEEYLIKDSKEISKLAEKYLGDNINK